MLIYDKIAIRPHVCYGRHWRGSSRVESPNNRFPPTHWTIRYATFSGIKREEYTYTVSDNGMLRKIFGLDGDEVAGYWRKLHTEKLHDFHLPPHTVTKLKQSL